MRLKYFTPKTQNLWHNSICNKTTYILFKKKLTYLLTWEHLLWPPSLKSHTEGKISHWIFDYVMKFFSCCFKDIYLPNISANISAVALKYVEQSSSRKCTLLPKTSSPFQICSMYVFKEIILYSGEKQNKEWTSRLITLLL